MTPQCLCQGISNHRVWIRVRVRVRVRLRVGVRVGLRVRVHKIQQTEYFVMFDKRDQSVLSFIEWYFFSFFLLCLHVPQMTP